MSRVLGCQVSGLRCRVSGLGCWISGLIWDPGLGLGSRFSRSGRESRVSGLKSGFGLRVLGLRSRLRSQVGSWILGLGSWVSFLVWNWGFGFQFRDFSLKVLGLVLGGWFWVLGLGMGFRSRILGLISGLGVSGFGYRVSGFGVLVSGLGFGIWTLGFDDRGLDLGVLGLGS